MCSLAGSRSASRTPAGLRRRSASRTWGSPSTSAASRTAPPCGPSSPPPPPRRPPCAPRSARERGAERHPSVPRGAGALASGDEPRRAAPLAVLGLPPAQVGDRLRERHHVGVLLVHVEQVDRVAGLVAVRSEEH